MYPKSFFYLKMYPKSSPTKFRGDAFWPKVVHKKWKTVIIYLAQFIASGKHFLTEMSNRVEHQKRNQPAIEIKPIVRMRNARTELNKKIQPGWQ